MKRHILFFLISLFLFPIIAQDYHQGDSYSFNADKQGWHIYEAKNSIRLSDGFSYSASSAESFTAKVNNKILFPNMTNAYLKSDGKTTTSIASEGYAVGAIPGQFNVSPTGAATYTIPIEVPPGVNGMQPNIALSYNSQAGNGIAGWGWNISGLSAITSVKSTVFYDGIARGIEWQYGDALTLDGIRLIVIDDSYYRDSVVYRTEIDNGMHIVGYGVTYITSVQTPTRSTLGQPTYFKVKTKDGKTITLGSSNNSRQRNEYATYSWQVTRIEDKYKNYVAFEYDFIEYSVNRLRFDFRIDEITYGHMNSIVGKVKFNYSNTRNVKQEGYIAGFKNSNQCLLDSIQVFSGSDQLRKYTLNYKSDEDRLLSIGVEGMNGSSYKETEFVWKTNEFNVGINSGISVGGGNLYNEIISDGYNDEYFFEIIGNGDLDGYGTSELLIKWTFKDTRKEGVWPFRKDVDYYKYTWGLYRRINDTYYTCFYEKEWDLDEESNFIFLDADYDGKDELYFLGTYEWAIEVVPGSGLYRNIISRPLKTYEPDLNVCVFYESPLCSGSTRVIIPGNFVGDGNIHLLKINKENEIEAICNMLDNTTVTPTNNLKIKGELNRLLITDINGNGKSELFMRDGSEMYFYEFNNDDFELIYSYTASDAPTTYNIIRTGDFNGDGNTDLLVDKDTQSFSSQTYELWVSDGTRLIKQLFSGFGVFDANTSIKNFFITDLDGDGLDDILAETFDDQSQKLHYLFNKGELNFSQGYVHNLAQSLSPFSNLFEYKHNKNIMLKWNNGHLEVNHNAIYNKIDSIKTFKGSTCIEYSRTGNIYSNRESTLDWGNEDADNTTQYSQSVMGGFVTVTKVSTNNNENQSYSYNNAVFSPSKGFLGFKNTSLTDEKNNLTVAQEMNFNQDYNILLPSHSKKIKNGYLLSENKQYSTIDSIGEKRFRILADSTIQKNHLNNTGTKTTYESYDTDGNPTSIKTEYYNGDNLIPNYYQQTTTSYTDEGSWGVKYLPSNMTKLVSNGDDTESRMMTFDYNSNGSLYKKTIAPDSTFELQTTYDSYDAYGNVTFITSSTPNDASISAETSTMQYTDDGRFIKSKTSGGMTTSYKYDLTKSQLLAETSPSGLTTRYFYNGLGQKYKTLSPIGVESYTTLNWVMNDTDAPSDALYYSLSKTSGVAETRTYYNAKGQVRRTLSYGFGGEKIYADKEYDSKDRLSRESLPYFKGVTALKWTIYAYNASYDRLSEVTAPDGTISKTIYDDANRKVTSQVKKNDVIQQSIKYTNELGQTEISEDNMSNKVHYVYDVAGRLKESWVNDLTQHKTTFSYDSRGNRLKVTDPDAGVISNTYDALGRILTQTNARGHYSIYNYDDLGRVYTQITKKSINGSTLETLEYNHLNSGVAIGQLNWVKLNGETKENYSYDNMGRMNGVTEYIDGESFPYSNTYDDYGRIAKQSYPSGYTIANVYNAQGDLWQITHDNQVIYENSDFTAMGALTDYDLGSNNVTRNYDKLGRLDYQGCGSRQSMSYAYDDMGNLEYREDGVYAGQIETFNYDNLNRLLGIKYTAWGAYEPSKDKYMTYDATGNILSKTGVGADMKYGENGKPHALTSINTPMNYQPNNQNITYTYFNKAKLITQGNYTYQYTYGIDHQRRKTVYKEGSTVKRTKYYLGNYEKVIDENGTKEYHYLSADCGMFGIFVKTNGNSGELKYVLTDHLGSLTEVLDASTNQPVQSLSFSAWGMAREAENWNNEFTGELFADRGFTGHEHLPAIFGLIDMNGRMYDPVLGRFLSPDPYVQSPDYAQNFNRYAYCYNNPLVYSDPDGEFILTAMVVGAFINYVIQDMSGNIDSGGDVIKAVGIGALTGAAGAGAGSLVSGAVGGSVGFLGGAAIGGAGGAAGGFVGGAGNAWANGSSFNEGLITGLKVGGVGALTGGAIGGVFGGITSFRHDGNFWTGNGATFDQVASITTTGTKAEAYTNNNAKNFSDKHFGKVKGLSDLYADGSMPNGYEKVGDDVFNKYGTKVSGTTVKVGLGKSDVYLYKSAFTSSKQLYVTMGHEYIHVGHFNSGLFNVNKSEHAAYSWEVAQKQAFGMLKSNQTYNIKYLNPGYYDSSYDYTKFANPIINSLGL